MNRPLFPARISAGLAGLAGTLALIFGLTRPGEGLPPPAGPDPGQRPAPKVKPKAQPDDPDALPREIERLIALHNEDREAAELSPLEAEPRLRAAALRHALDMAKNNAMDHRGSDGTTFVDRMKDEDYPIRRGAENIAWGQRTPEQVMSTWRKSPPHKKNILGEYTQVGAAVTKSKRGIPYWCVVFGTPLESPKAAAAKDAETPGDRDR